MRLFGTGMLIAALVGLAAPADAQSSSQAARRPQAAGQATMTAAEIQALLIGTAIESIAPDGSRAIIHHTADGKSVYELIRGEKKTRVNGIWKMRGNQFCRRFDRPKETEVCFDYRKVNDATAAVYNGKKLVARQTRLP